MKEYLNKAIEERAVKCLNILPIEMLQDDCDFRIAGGCLVMDKPNDYDLFMASPATFYRDYFEKNSDYTLVCKTKNAYTIKRKRGGIIQLCNYWKDTLAEQIDAFDFAHIQVGVEICNLDGEGSFFSNSLLRIQSINYSEEFIEATITGRTWVCNERLEYPMATVMRCQKYKDRGLMSKSAFCTSMVYAMSQVYARGIKSYEDFKDQLDAVDLGFVFESTDNAVHDMLKEAYNNFNVQEPIEDNR